MQWGLLAAGLALVGATAATARRLRDHRVVPLLAHNLPWSVALIVAGSGLIYYDRLSVKAITLLILGIGAFNAGIFISPSVGRWCRVRPSSDFRRPLIDTRIYIGLWAGFAVGLLSLLWTISRLFGLGTLLSDPTAIRRHGDISYLVEFPLWGKVLFYLGPLLFTLTVNSGMVSGLQARPRTLRFSMAGVILLAQAASLQRTNIFVSLVLALAVYAYRTELNRARVSRLLLATGLVALVGLVAFTAIGAALHKNVNSVPTTAQYFSPAARDSQLADVMFYGSSGTIAFGKLTESSNSDWPPEGVIRAETTENFNPQTWGAASFPWALKVIPITRAWPEVEPQTRIPMPTNVYTWLSPWYRDFRWVGVALFPLLVGSISGLAALRSRRSDSWALIAGLFTSCAVWAPFTNRFLSTLTIELLVISLVLLWVENRGIRFRRPPAA